MCSTPIQYPYQHRVGGEFLGSSTKGLGLKILFKSVRVHKANVKDILFLQFSSEVSTQRFRQMSFSVLCLYCGWQKKKLSCRRPRWSVTFLWGSCYGDERNWKWGWGRFNYWPVFFYCWYFWIILIFSLILLSSCIALQCKGGQRVSC